MRAGEREGESGVTLAGRRVDLQQRPAIAGPGALQHHGQAQDHHVQEAADDQAQEAQDHVQVDGVGGEKFAEVGGRHGNGG